MRQAMLFISLLLAGLLLVGCSTETVEVPVEVTRIVEATRIVETVKQVEVPVEVTRIVEVTVEVPSEDSSSPSPSGAGEFFTLEGSGNSVTDNFEWGACAKSVFSWEFDKGTLWVDFYDETGDDFDYIGATSDETTGEKLIPLDGGEYYLAIDAKGNWTLVGTCKD